MEIILRFRYLIIFALASATNLFFYFYQGIRIVNDSERYMEYAHQIAIGNFYQEHNIWYFAYCGFLALFVKFNLGINHVIITQIILAIIASLSFQQACENFTQNKLKGLISSLLFLAFIEISGWNTYILTESLFISFTCFFLYAFSLFVNKKDIKSSILIIFSLIVVFWLRPMGVALLCAFICYLYFDIFRVRINKWAHHLILFAALFIGLFMLNQMLRTFHLIENYATGEIVFGISRIPTYKGHEQILLNVPENLIMPTEGSTLYKAAKFYTLNPIFAFKLSFLKGFYYLSHYKPYYSFTHNLHSLIILIPCYIGLVVFLIREKLNPLKLFVISFLTLNTLIIMITSVDWDGRFLMGLAPIIFCFCLANKQILNSLFQNEKAP